MTITRNNLLATLANYGRGVRVTELHTAFKVFKKTQESRLDATLVSLARDGKIQVFNDSKLLSPVLAENLGSLIGCLGERFVKLS